MSLKELIYVLDSNFDEVETLLNRKGYDFFENDNKNKCTDISYAFDRQRKNNTARAYLTKSDCGNTLQSVNFHAPNKDNYILIKEQTKKNGFNFFEQKTDSFGYINYVYIHHDNGKYRLEISPQLTNDGRNIYLISLTSTPNMYKLMKKIEKEENK